jgi:hypothetical protein
VLYVYISKKIYPIKIECSNEKKKKRGEGQSIDNQVNFQVDVRAEQAIAMSLARTVQWSLRFPPGSVVTS